MSKRIKILTPRIYEHSDFFHDAVDFARENSLNTNELCLELSHYLVDNFNKVWKIEKPRIYKKISDLEAKLEELRKQITICDEENSKTFMKFVDVCRQNAELKQQLAEKEKEIESLKDNWNALCDYLGENIAKNYSADYEFIYNELLEKVNELKKYDYKRYQDKISFCIEKLEKVKDELTKLEQNYNLNLCDVKIYNFIDNQIKELQEKKGE